MRVCLSVHCADTVEKAMKQRKKDKIESAGMFCMLTMIYRAPEWNIFWELYTHTVANPWSSPALLGANILKHCFGMSTFHSGNFKIEIAAWFLSSNLFWFSRLEVESTSLLFLIAISGFCIETFGLHWVKFPHHESLLKRRATVKNWHVPSLLFPISSYNRGRLSMGWNVWQW